MRTSELLRARAQHMDSLARLGRESAGWDEITRRRGLAVAARLVAQVQAIDEQLAGAGGRAA